MTDQDLIDLVAEKVMGWEVCTNLGFSTYRQPSGYITNDWNPLASMDDAWMVVERMVGGGLYPNLDVDEEGWTIELMWGRGFAEALWPGFEDTGLTSDKNAGRAICIAALGAAGEAV